MNATLRKCRICNNIMREREVTTNLQGALPVLIAMCKVCDVRKCKKDHYVQDGHARRCPDCSEVL